MSKVFKNNSISLDIGAGGAASWDFFKDLRKILKFTGKWKNIRDDAAVFDLSNAMLKSPYFPLYKRGIKGDFNLKLVMTTDAFIVDPLFFPGGDIGKISICGTINDLSVMGAKPLGISLSMVIEEGFPKKDLIKIITSVQDISKRAGVPVVTGDTKVTQKGKIDKIEITTAGIGIASKIIQNNGAKPDDKIIVSGDLGEHGAALLAKRFNYKTKIASDSKPLNKEIGKVGKFLHSCKDPTRGGLAANLVEMAEKSKVKIILEEKYLPYKKDVIAVSELLGIDVFSFPSEGRFVAAVEPKNEMKVLKILREFSKEAKTIGKAKKGGGVYLKTKLGSLRPIEMPQGKLIPRIC